MNVLYHIPFTNTIYAGRTIYNGYRHAFEDLGHRFRTLTAGQYGNDSVFDRFHPDLLMTSLSKYYLKYLDLSLVLKWRKKGMKVLVQLPFWRSSLSSLRINETPRLSTNIGHINLIKSGKFGDFYHNVCEQDDERMNGFENNTGIKWYTIPLAADKKIIYKEYSDKFKADISFIGTNLPERRQFFKEYVFPLAREFDLKLYGQDWTLFDRGLGYVQKVGQYLNIPVLRSVQKPKLDLGDERKVYSSSLISINVHGDYQRKHGGDCNERTFKIPLAAGFEVTDNVKCIARYFVPGREMVIAEDHDDWVEKVRFYLKNPEQRIKIIESGQARVLKDHTYETRVKQIISLMRG